MSVFFRTGENTAASVSWPVYLIFVLPFQLLYGFAKLLVLGLKWLMIGAVAAGALLFAGARAARDAWNDRKPPHPEG